MKKKPLKASCCRGKGCFFVAQFEVRVSSGPLGSVRVSVSHICSGPVNTHIFGIGCIPILVEAARRSTMHVMPILSVVAGTASERWCNRERCHCRFVCMRQQLSLSQKKNGENRLFDRGIRR